MNTILIILMSFYQGSILDKPVHLNNNVKWVVTLEKEEENYYLYNEFSSLEDYEKICFETFYEMLPVSLDNFEYNASLRDRVHKLDFYLYEFTHSQIIIENDKGDMETLSFNIKMPKTGNTYVHSQYGDLEDLSDVFLIDKERLITIKEPINLEYLKLIDGSESVRLHYLSKGCEVRDNYILSSSWVKVP